MNIKKRLKLAFKRAKAEGFQPTCFRLHPDDVAQYVKDFGAHGVREGPISAGPPPPPGPCAYAAIKVDGDRNVPIGTVAADTDGHGPGFTMGEVDLEIDDAWQTYRDSSKPMFDSELCHAKGFQAGARYGAAVVLEAATSTIRVVLRDTEPTK